MEKYLVEHGFKSDYSIEDLQKEMKNFEMIFHSIFLPNNPCGRKSKNTTRTTKAIAALYPEGRNQIPIFSTSPSRNAPATAPRTLPSPPTTAAVKPAIIAASPIVGSRFCSIATKTPALAARADASAKT